MFNSSQFDFHFDAAVSISGSAVNIANKEELVLAFVNHYPIYTCKGELDQFKSGLMTLGIQEKMKKLFFIVGLIMYINVQVLDFSHYMRVLILIFMCTIGTGRQVGEVVIKLLSILSFVTGLDCIPALGFECDPEIEFIRNDDKGRLPYASTCMPTLYLLLS